MQRFCTIDASASLFYVADQIIYNDWNFNVPAQAGSVGLGAGSPLYAIANAGATTSYYVQF